MNKMIALLLGVVFIVIGGISIAGIANPIVGAAGSGAMFETNPMHDYVHIGSGLVLIAGALTVGARATLLLVGVVYAIVAVLGYVAPDMLMNYIHLNEADKWLHVGLAVVLLGAGLLPDGKAGG